MSNSQKELEILEAAKKCFAQYGYEKTTMDDIGKISRLNKASLYYYYKNKEAIFTAVIIKESEESLELLQTEIHDTQDCHERIIAYQRERIRQMKTMVNLQALSINTLINESPQFEELFQQISEMEAICLEKILRKCVDNGDFISCDTRRIAETILTIGNALKHKAMQGSNFQFADIDYQKLEEETVFTISLILNGIRNK